jgi:hypothetical protein
MKMPPDTKNKNKMKCYTSTRHQVIF